MTYVPKPLTQRDGSPLASSNCLMVAAAVGLDFHTLGGKTSTGAKMREYSGDSSGGTNSDEIERAWKSGYSEDPAVRDGRPWSDVLADLNAGRMVMLQVWHATVGGPCLSGSGAYGHGLSVLPDLHSDGERWKVSDPWCKPPKWSWVSEAKLKAGAEKWAEKMTFAIYGANGGRLRDADPAVLQAAIKLLMSRWNPDHPARRDPPGAGGAAGVLFASTRAQSSSGGTDVTINANGSAMTSKRALDVGEGLNIYGDAELTDQLGEFGSDQTVKYVGPAVGPAPGIAILIHTGYPYDDGQRRDSVVYVNPDHVGDPYTLPDAPDDPIAARDAEWRAWLDGDGDAPDRP